MLNFQFYQRVKLLCGNGCVAQLGELLSEIGVKKAFIVCDQGIVDVGIADKVTHSLEQADIAYYLYSKVTVDPPVDMAEQAAALCHREACDAVIAVGGGSCMDTGKAVNMMRFNKGPILR